jgi:hypothetical protein
MNRRTFLSRLTLVGIGSVAGCATQISPPVLTPLIESDDLETHLQFGPQDNPVAIATFRTHGDIAGGQSPLRLTVWHRKGTHVDSLSVSALALSDSSEIPKQISLGLDGDVLDATVRFSKMVDGTPVVELSDLGDAGHDNVHLDLWVARGNSPPTECAVQVVTEITESGLLGGTYKCHGGTVLSL